jgi:DNA repair protein RadC
MTVHRYVTHQQVVSASQPTAADLPTLFREWGLLNATQELFWVIALDNMTGLKTVTEVAKGGFHDVLVHIPTVLTAVVAAHTDRFYVAHNHPAGPVTPTEEDYALTAQIMEAANVAGLSFEDHIICGPKGWFSFYDKGLLIRAERLGMKAATRKPRRTKGVAP